MPVTDEEKKVLSSAQHGVVSLHFQSVQHIREIQDVATQLMKPDSLGDRYFVFSDIFDESFFSPSLRHAEQHEFNPIHVKSIDENRRTAIIMTIGELHGYVQFQVADLIRKKIDEMNRDGTILLSGPSTIELQDGKKKQPDVLWKDKHTGQRGVVEVGDSHFLRGLDKVAHQLLHPRYVDIRTVIIVKVYGSGVVFANAYVRNERGEAEPCSKGVTRYPRWLRFKGEVEGLEGEAYTFPLTPTRSATFILQDMEDMIRPLEKDSGDGFDVSDQQ